MTYTPATGTGAGDYIAYSVPETTAGVAVARTKFLNWETNTIAPKADQLNKSLASGIRTANRVRRPLKVKLGGQVAWPLMAHQGVDFIRGALGKYAPLTAVNDTTPGTGTNFNTTGTATTITLTTGTGFAVGALVLIDVGSSMEIRQIKAFDSVGKTITVAALSLVHAQANIAIVQPAMHKFSPYAPADANRWTLPSYTIEDIGSSGVYSYVMPGTYVDKLNWKGDKDLVSVTADLIPAFNPTRSGPSGASAPASGTQPTIGTTTTYAPSAAESADPSQVFTILDGYLTVPNDNTGLGASALSFLSAMETWEIDWSNSGIQKPYWDLSKIYKYAAPGIAMGDLKWTYSNYAGRWAEFEDYIATLNVVNPSWMAMVAHNVGTVASPSYYGVSWYVPTIAMVDAPPKRSLTDVDTIDVTAAIDYQTADALQVFVLNSIAPVSNAY